MQTQSDAPAQTDRNAAPAPPVEPRIETKQIGHDTPAYREMVALRYRILREPLGLNFTPEQLKAEANDTLIGTYIAGELVGCLILTRLDAQKAQMRQVAVDTARQRGGIGRALVGEAERWARQQGHDTLLLHARESAIPFYLKMGYEAQGEPFEEVGLPHLEMRKTLSE